METLPSPSNVFDAALLAPGEVFYTGTPAEDACLVDFALSVSGVAGDGGHQVSVARDDACNFALVGRGPVTPAVHDALPEGSGPSTCGTGLSRLYGQIWNYGYGGNGDKLDRLELELHYTWNCNSAAYSNHFGWCAGSNHISWRWVVDGCWDYGHSWSGSSVWAKDVGEYHCDPRGSFPCNISSPDGYDHDLHLINTGYGGGGYNCTGGYAGLIVAGVDIVCGTY